MGILLRANERDEAYAKAPENAMKWCIEALAGFYWCSTRRSNWLAP